MKLIRGGIHQDNHRDILWQRSFIDDDEGKIMAKIVICVDHVELARILNRDIASVESYQIDDDVKRWFEDKTKQQYKEENITEVHGEISTYFDVYPRTEDMLQAARLVSRT